MKAKTPGEVIAVLESQLNMWQMGFNRDQHIIACLARAIAIVRKAERKRKWRSK